MSKKIQANFVTGIIAGAILMLIAGTLFKFAAPAAHNGSGEVLAEMKGASLTRGELEKHIAGFLVPIENDEYDTMLRGIESWLEFQLLEKEAKAKNISVKDLYTQDVWGKIRVSSGDALAHYNKNSGLYGGQPFEKVSSGLIQQLRAEAYEKAKKDYLNELRQKYAVKVHLEKPSSYVQGLAVPRSVYDELLVPTPAVKPSAPAPSVPGQPAALVTFNDLAGKPSKGPENAVVTLVEFSDFHCPFCSKVGPALDQLMKNYEGKIRRVWRHYPLPFHKGADKTHAASECAQEQGKFWEFHDKAFELQTSLQSEATLNQIADQIGLDKKKFEQCVSSNKYMAKVQADIAKAGEVGVRGTPAFFLNGRLVSGAKPYQEFANIVEGILDPSKAVPLPAAPAAPKPAPTNVQFDDLKGRPSMGPENAPITLVEFSDFHCPFCSRVEPTIDEIMKNYEGKVRKVWRHYPLSFHVGAERVHEASECAHEQGKFWEFQKEAFKNMGNTKDDASILRVAEQAGVNKDKLEKCLQSGKYKAQVQADIAKGNASGVSGTPAVFVNGQLVSGAQPYASFDAIIQAKLNEKK